MSVLKHRLHNIKRVVKSIIRKKMYAQPRLIFMQSHPVAYMVTYKTASSSILGTICKLGGIVDIDSSQVHTLVNQVTDKEVENPNDYYIFTFVRNPFEILVSCYEDKVVKEANRKEETFNYYLWGYLKRSNSFDQFVRRVNRIPNNLLEHHIASQYDVIETLKKEKKIVFDFIGRFENMYEDFKKIQEHVPLEDLPHFNQTKKKDWRDYYTRELAEIVYKKYEKDIKSFGYESSYSDLLNYIYKKEK